ncbi:MAG: CvpA family protein [Bacilli bacterium]|nr:CvpA family protein [Bacilli bacterium]
MSIIDIGIVIVILFGGILGFKRGFTKELVVASGFIIAVILAFILKNYVSEFLYMNAPFFKFGGLIKGVTVLNIALYELIAFLVVLALLMILLKVLTMITGIFETFLNMTIILGIPSKILGLILGLVESYIWVFIILYVIAMPIFSFDLSESKYQDKILNNTPLLSSYASNANDVLNEFGSLKEKYQNSNDADEFNLETLDLFLKYKIITIESVDKLIAKDKLLFSSLEKLNNVLDKYREG